MASMSSPSGSRKAKRHLPNELQEFCTILFDAFSQIYVAAVFIRIIRLLVAGSAGPSTQSRTSLIQILYPLPKG